MKLTLGQKVWVNGEEVKIESFSEIDGKVDDGHPILLSNGKDVYSYKIRIKSQRESNQNNPLRLKGNHAFRSES